MVWVLDAVVYIVALFPNCLVYTVPLLGDTFNCFMGKIIDSLSLCLLNGHSINTTEWLPKYKKIRLKAQGSE